MKKTTRLIKYAAVFLTAAVLSAGAFADGVIHHSVLQNGLEVFITQNKAAPLVYIEIAVKAGGISQTPENAGLFHLYEHMLFKGNTKYPTAAAVQRALSDMGVTSWNGSTAHEYINYYFTVPSAKLREGLEFWSYALREPLIEKNELENEKKVVISEISGGFAEPGRIYSHAVNSFLFPDRPWKLDPAGTVENVEKSDSSDLRNIQQQYYVPENSALFIGGDIDPHIALELADEIYGSWKPAQNIRTRIHTPENKKISAQNSNAQPILTQQTVQTELTELTQRTNESPRFYVFPTEMVSPAAARADVFFRGPDTADDTESTYAADIWSSLVSHPSGRFLQTLVSNKKLGIPSPDYAGAGYLTRRESGRITFSAFITNPSDSIAERSAELTRIICEEEIPAMIENSSYFSEAEISAVKQKIIDSSVFDTETAEGLLSTLRFWWASSSADYFFTYEEKTLKTDRQDISSFINTYMKGVQPVTAVMVHPSVYEKNRQSFEKLGFSVITGENAFWWKRRIPQTADTSVEKSHYNENENKQTAAAAQSSDIETFYLSNKIPVVIYKSQDSRVNDIKIGIIGGVPLIEKNKAGTEDALISLMVRGSEKYPAQTVRDFSYSTQTTFNSASFNDFSYISAAGIDSYFMNAAEMLIEGFLHPTFDEDELSRLIIEYRQYLQQRSSDPSAILADAVRRQMYSGHQYETSSKPDDSSVGTLTADMLKNHHQTILDPSRIVVSAAGNFNTTELLSILEQSIGRISGGTTISSDKKTSQKINDLEFDKKTVQLTSAAAQGTGYYAQVFPYPSLYDSGYTAAAIAASVYDDILFNVVREKYGSCYSIGNDAAVSKVSYGMTAAVKVSDMHNIEKYIDEAADIMKQNKIIDGKDEKTGAFSLIALSDRIESYKNSFINSYYNSLRTNSGISSRMMTGFIYRGDPSDYKKAVSKIEAVTAQDIYDVFIKYWTVSEKLIFTVTGG